MRFRVSPLPNWNKTLSSKSSSKRLLIFTETLKGKTMTQNLRWKTSKERKLCFFQSKTF
jgi:hypothetical protein